jgi:hypothetical protein
MPALSVVIVNWNAGATLPACLASVFGSRLTGGPPEVLLVDNASTDGSVELAIQAHPGISVIRNPDNRGFARAANQGLARAGGELLLLLNPDVVLEPDAMAILAGVLRARPDVAAVGPRLLDADGSVQASARRDPSPWTGLFGRRSLLTRLFPANPWSRRELPALAAQGDEPQAVDWVSGACLMTRRTVCDAVGPLDEGFFLFWEDADWCRRFRRAGGAVWYVPAARGVHRAGVSRAQRPVRSAIDFHRSAYRYYRKHALPAPAHPMALVLVGGVMATLAADLLRAVVFRRAR